MRPIFATVRIAQALAVLAMAVFSSDGHADGPAVVRAEAQTRTVDCAGGDAEVGGNRNTLTFTGACRSLTLRGDANRVDVSLAPDARIDIEGNGNRIRYRVASGAGAPSVRVSGSNTDLASVEGGLPPASPPTSPVNLSGDNQSLDVNCAGRPVSIQGNRSRYVLRGGCASLSVHGDANAVRAELQPHAAVEIEGNGTTLTYTVLGGGAGPDAVVRGNDSRAVASGGLAGSSAASPAPPRSKPPTPPEQPSAGPAADANRAVPNAPAPAQAVPSAPSPPPSVTAASPPAPTVPILMHDLGAKVVADGTLVTIPIAALFDGDGVTLRADAPSRLAPLAQLGGQIHPSAVRVAVIGRPGDVDDRRARAVAQWLAGEGGLRAPTEPRDGGADGEARVDVLLAR